jgi:hypothetical protein
MGRKASEAAALYITTCFYYPSYPYFLPSPAPHYENAVDVSVRGWIQVMSWAQEELRSGVRR